MRIAVAVRKPPVTGGDQVPSRTSGRMASGRAQNGEVISALPRVSVLAMTGGHFGITEAKLQCAYRD